MQNLVSVSDEIKAVVASCTGTPTAKLIALLEAAGITASADIAAMLGVAIRTVQHARKGSKSATHCANTQPIAAQPIASDATHCVSAQPIAPRARVEEKPLPPKQEETASKLASLNVADEIVQDLIEWVPGFDDKSARNWLAGTVRTFGSEVVQQAWHKLKTDMATGSVVARPIQTLTSICQRMKAQGVIAKPANSTPPKEARKGKVAVNYYGQVRWIDAPGAVQ